MDTSAIRNRAGGVTKNAPVGETASLPPFMNCEFSLLSGGRGGSPLWSDMPDLFSVSVWQARVPPIRVDRTHDSLESLKQCGTLLAQFGSVVQRWFSQHSFPL